MQLIRVFVDDSLNDFNEGYSYFHAASRPMTA